MSTHANGTQQTYDEIWAGMEEACSGLMAVAGAGHGPGAALTQVMDRVAPSTLHPTRRARDGAAA